MISWWRVRGKIKFHAYDRPVYSCGPVKSLCRRAELGVGVIGLPWRSWATPKKAQECVECRRRMDRRQATSGDVDCG